MICCGFLVLARAEHSALAQSNIKIGVHVRLVDGRGYIVSWHKPVHGIVLYGHDPAAKETCKTRRMPGRWPKRCKRPSVITSDDTPKKPAPPARCAS
jgi:hypothetical protein